VDNTAVAGYRLPIPSLLAAGQGGMRKKKGSSVQSVRAIALIVALVLSLPWQAAAAENVLILNGDFVQKYKNRATIEANYVIDKAHKKPNPPSKDADIHVAGRSPEIGLATVAEVMNAAERPDALQAIHAAEGTGQPVQVTGVWRIWPEHGGDSEQTQGKTLAPFTTTNPEHLFEIHPVTQIAGIDVKNTFHPIDGYQPKDTEQAFGVYERTRSRITPLAGNKVKLEMPMAGMNYVKFEMELNEKALAVADGRMVFAKVRDSQGELVARKRRMVFAKDTPPEVAIRDKGAGDCLVVFGIPRVDLSLVDWRVKQSKKGRKEVLSWGLPYEIAVVGVYDEPCSESD
jgi:hypothetical protein